MAGIQLSGLASGFDWKSLVDQLMAVEQAPITRLQKEQTQNSQRSSALGDLQTKLTALQTAATGLSAENLFTGRTATSSTSGSTWSPSASPGTVAGNYTLSVSQLATAARRQGSADIGQPLSSTSDVSGLTLSTLRTGTAVTAGSFSVNGQKITVALTDSLQDVFDAIATATAGNGDVTASYDSSTDRITLSGTGEITLGAANDTSNILRVLKVGNNGTGVVTSSGSLGSVKTTGAIAGAGLAASITAVDSAGDGSFSINGVSISYNVNSDSLSTIIKRINSSSAGVIATYDTSNDRLTLTNSTTGDIGIAMSEASGGLLDALGIGAAGTLVRGLNAEFSINGGPTLTSASNTLDSTAHGVTGLSVTVDSETTQSIGVAADTATMKSKIQSFIDAYNAVQAFIDDKTRITSQDGTVTTSVLTSNREVQSWARDLRSLAFGAVSGLDGTIQRLADLGIDFTSGTSQLEIKDSAVLDTALRDKPADVEAFFQSASTGFAAKFDTRMTNLIDSNDQAQENYTKANASIDQQIADIQRRLDQERDLMEQSFYRMEEAQAKLQQQSSALSNAFSSSK